MKNVAALVLLLAVPCLAQKREEKKPRPEARPVQQVNFEDDLIDGVRLHPDNEVIVVRTPTRFDSLIVLRKDFNDKIRDSIDEL